MANRINPLFYEFDDFSVDAERRLLMRRGEPISLTPKVFDTLLILIEHRGEVVDKDLLMKELWTDSFVEEANITQNIAVLRRALGEKAKENKFIATVPGRGYRFVAEVRFTAAPIASAPDNDLTHDAWPVVGTEELVLTSGAGSADAAVDFQGAGPAARIESKLLAGDSPPLSASRAPVRRSTRGPMLIAALAVSAVVVGLFLYWRSFPATPVEGSHQRLAVLPLKPINIEERDRGVELAIADSLILKLNEAKVFQVRPLSAVRDLLDVSTDPIESGRQLGVDYVLVCNYQIAEGRIRVTSQLINVASGAAEQSFKSESSTENFFAMQDNVANEIGNGVLERFGKPVSNVAAKHGTQNEEASSLFYEALYLVDKNNKDDSEKAAELLGQAVLLDPNYSQAWALRAQAYCQFAHQGGGAPDEVFTIAEPMLDKALALDRNNSTALLVKGIIARDYHWKFDDSYRNLQQAVELDPNNWFPHRELAVLYHHDGRFNDAVNEQKRALEIYPTSVVNRWLLGVFQIAAGDRDEGIAQQKRVIEMDPSFTPPYETLWQTYHFHGDGANAFQNFLKQKELVAAKSEAIAQYKEAYARGGWPAVLRTELDLTRAADVKGEYSGRKYYIATIAALVGDNDTAIEYLEQSLRFHLIGMSWIKVDQRLDPLRGDPRFQDILLRTGLAAV